MEFFNWFYIEYKVRLTEQKIDINILEQVYTDYILNDGKNTVFKSVHPPCLEIKVSNDGTLATPLISGQDSNITIKKLSQQGNFIMLNLQSLSRQMDQMVLQTSNQYENISKSMAKLKNDETVPSSSFTYPQKITPILDTNKFHIPVQTIPVLPSVIHTAPKIPEKVFKTDLEQLIEKIDAKLSTLSLNTLTEIEQTTDLDETELPLGDTSIQNLENMFNNTNTEPDLITNELIDPPLNLSVFKKGKRRYKRHENPAQFKKTYPPLERYTQFVPALISSLFATISSFEASYLNFQAAHVPKVDQIGLESADKDLVLTLQKLTDLRNLYRDFRKNPSGNFGIPVGSFLECQVQENQSKLRALETTVNKLISDFECKDEQVLILRKNLDKVLSFNSNLQKRLVPRNKQLNKEMEVLLTVWVFESMLRDCIKSLHCFTKLLIDLMRKSGWDLEMAANSVYSNVDYGEKGHFKYAFLSYFSLGMFRGFDLNDFLLYGDEIVCNRNGSIYSKENCLKELIQHVSCNPIEVLGKNPKCEFSRFCEQKYEQLIHPTMESSIFSNLERKEVVLDSWRSLSVLHVSFVRMASSIWLLHKLAYSFDPVVEIFQVARGVDFSMVYMEDVTRKTCFSGKTRPKVAFTVVPGFKVGRTIVQSQVYLNGTNCTERVVCCLPMDK